MKYYIIAGEASGDLHGSNLIVELKKKDPQAEIRCWGGDLMQTAGADLAKHYRDLAFMGFTEVVKNLPTILRNLTFCKNDITSYNPDVLILIDYPGFNLRIAEWARKKGLRIVYYISPQVWAWKENRVKGIRKNTDKMLVILPFEKGFYERHQMEVEYVGHPLLPVIDQFIEANKSKPNPWADKQIIALLPGSRKQEIEKKLPLMLAVASDFPDYQFVVAKAPGIEDDFYNSFMKAFNNVEGVTGQTYHLLLHAKAALVTSGTATLETALFGVPEIICYKSNNLSYQIAKRLVKIKYIGLVNLIMNKEVVKELIQHDLTVENIRKELNLLLTDSKKISDLKQDYADLRNALGSNGNASERAATSIIQLMNASVSGGKA